MGKILVKASPQLQYDMQGKPSFVLPTGGGGKGGGSTKREKILGGLGGAVGVLGALTGKHRSLGGLMGSMYAGGVQGKNLGRGLGRGLTSRNRQSRADLQEKEKQEYTDMRAQRQAQGKDVDSPFVGVLPNIRGTPVKGDEARRTNMGKWAKQEAEEVATTKRHMKRAKLDDPQENDLALAQQVHAELMRREAKRRADEHEGIEPGTQDAVMANGGNILVQSSNMGGNSQGSVGNGDETVLPEDSDSKRNGLAEGPIPNGPTDGTQLPSGQLNVEEKTRYDKLMTEAAGLGMQGFGNTSRLPQEQTTTANEVQ